MSPRSDRIGDPEERADDRDLELACGRAASRTSSGSWSPEQLAIFIEAARRRGEPLDHVLLAGPPGLGKTSLAGIIAAELGVGDADRRRAGAGAQGRRRRLPHHPASRATSSSSTRSTASTPPSRRSSTRRWRTASSTSCSARARRRARIRLQLPPFTLIGATTRTGLLTTPLRDRFGVWHRLEYYEPEELGAHRASAPPASSGSRSTTPAAVEIAGRSRGTPRVANRLLRRVRDFAQVAPRRRHRRSEIAVAALELLRGRQRGPRQARPRHPLRHRREVRRRSRRPRHAGRRHRRGGRHDRGRLRAVPPQAGLPQAHAARARAHADRVSRTAG